ncbi:MAG: type II and III secretion system protein family protein [Pseudomonadota bacterium]
MSSMVRMATLAASVAVFALTANPAFAEPGNVKLASLEQSQPATSRSLALAVNKTALIEFDVDVDDVIIANPTIADVSARDSRRMAVMALNEGESNIIFLDRQGRTLLTLDVTVGGRGVTELEDLLSRYLPNSSINAEYVNGTVLLSGEAGTLSEVDQAVQMASRYVEEDAPVINFISVSGKDQVLLKVRIVEMQRSVTKQLGVNLTGNLGLGDLASETVSDLFDTVTGLPLLDAGGEQLQGIVPAAPFSRSFQLSTTNNFPISGGSLGGLSLGGSYQNYVGGTLQSSAGAAIDALERIGLVRTLAEPNLTAISGEAAKFLAGGEFPVPVGQDDDGITIEFKPFGVGLGFTPVVLSEGRISLKVSTEVSELTEQGSLGGNSGSFVDSATGEVVTFNGISIPGLKVRRAETTVELPSGGSMVMAGLIQEQTRQNLDAIPGMKDLPVLGALFRSRDFINEETELVVIITPYLVDPTDPQNLRSPDDDLVLARDAQTVLFGRINEVYGVDGASTDKNARPSGPIGFIFD